MCQKALTDFLEAKRSAMPRFYFIGDDDLLEILGQAKDPNVIQSHLKKLFQGWLSSCPTTNPVMLYACVPPPHDLFYSPPSSDADPPTHPLAPRFPLFLVTYYSIALPNLIPRHSQSQIQQRLHHNRGDGIVCWRSGRILQTRASE